MKLVFKKLHAYGYLFSIFVVYLFLYPFLFYFSRRESRYGTLNKLRRLWGKWSSGLCGIFYHFEYEEAIDWDKNYVVCPNHTSFLDITGMSLFTMDDFSFMGKHELLHYPTTGIFFRTVDIPVKRDSNISAFRAFKRAADYLKGGRTMVIFPEGKISDDYPPHLQDFKIGAFKLAIAQQVPVIPVTFCNAWQISWDDGLRYGSQPGTCFVYVHKPIETDKMKESQAEELRDEVYGIIQQKLLEYENRYQYSR